MKKGYIEIPIPQQIPRGKGIHGTAYASNTSLRARIPKHERAEVNKAAEKLGVTPSNFVRWCAVQTANIINRK